MDDASLPLIGTPEAAWASFDGDDLCPTCQTPDQRREAAARLVEMIEREIRRRQSQDIGPDPYEAALVAYAMALRARGTIDAGTADKGSAASSQAARSPQDRVEASRTLRLRVAYTAAFLTQEPTPVRLEEYGNLQQKLGGQLLEPKWSVRGLNAQSGTYDAGGGLSEAVPLVVARRNGGDLLGSLPTIADGLLRGGALRTEHDGPVIRATPDSFVINVYDLGVGVLTAVYDVVVLADDLEASARALQGLGALSSAHRDQDAPFAAALQTTARAAAEEFARAIRAVIPGPLPPAWLSKGLPPAGSGVARPRTPDEEARLLWVHPLYVVDGAGVPAGSSVDATADVLAATFRKKLRINGGTFFPGIDSSVIAVTGRRGAENVPIRLTELHWAYYALYLAMDRGLLHVLDQQRWSEGGRLGRLEKDAEEIFTDYLRVMEARAKLDSALSALGGDELVVWETIAKVQRFRYLVDAVGRKLDLLEKLAQRRVEQATADRAGRMAKLLGFLSLLTVVTVAIALLSEAVGAREQGTGPLWVRLAVVSAAVAVSVLLYWLVFIRTEATSRYATGVGGSDRRRSRHEDRESRERRDAAGARSERVGTGSRGAR